ncbi:hypothetical protein HYPBUDRAFT_12747 [Hyphopichia burtonii NRRL Y-1933]|uniref:Zn(2)-C6 fungal-type domain-containing protein n=1 Tax=Hyphopichia burtonii NRRL Y-1933 TaxID=984485 RepID=A0A1E4RFZ9_9ASCO|nr:hypothetical protein HYPBUDRAFT_12747 [Hyphopichia burtonii NRRL Y-1933]ODV66183.1 hypothetical protein HYPBUDRAFT_12747 [Hyphopichia burtonii NRRL Y-1933]
MSESSPVSSQKSNANRRPVARRACLSCREKKIKCDGEPVNVVKTLDTNNKIIPDNPKVCSNCQFLGIECVFVASMRGGRRKKRSSTELENPISRNAKNLKPNSITDYENNSTNSNSNSSKLISPRGSNGSSSIRDGLNQFLLDQHNRFNSSSNDSKPISPTISYASTSYADFRPAHLASSAESSSKQPHSIYGYPVYDYRHHYPPSETPSDTPGAVANFYNHLPPPPPMPSHFRHHWPPPPPPPHMMGYPPPPPPPPHLMFYGPPPFGPGGPPPGSNSPGDYPHPRHWPPPPPHIPGYGPPPPPPHMLPPPPPAPQPGSSLDKESSIKSGDSNKDCSSRDRELERRYPYYSYPRHPYPPVPQSYSRSPSLRNHSSLAKFSHNREGKPILPPLDHSRASMIPGESSLIKVKNHEKLDGPESTTSALKHPTGSDFKSMDIDQPPTKSSSKSPILNAPSTSTNSSSSCAKPKKTIENESRHKSPFDPLELEHYELPTWEVLSQLLNYYYKFNHLDHKFLPSQEIFIERLSLRQDSSILHSLIATLSLNKSDLIESDDDFWIRKALKYWDNLSDFGMFLTFSFMSKTRSYKRDLDKYNELSSRIYQIIHYNRYLEVLQDDGLPFNRRQIYEREVLMRLIWSYWINNLIMFRYKQGYPYDKISKIFKEEKLEIDAYNSKIILPGNDDDYFNLKNLTHRFSLPDLINNDKKFNDSTSFIYAMKKFDDLLEEINRNEIHDNNQFSNSFNDFIEKNLFRLELINNDSEILVINSSVLASTFMSRYCIILQNGFQLKNLFTFKIYEFNNDKKTKLEYFNEISLNNFTKVTELPTLINELSGERINNLIMLIRQVLEVSKLFELGLGKFGNNTKERPTVIGITQTSHNDNSKPWWQDESLITFGKEMWKKYPEFSLDIACSLIAILASLIVLTKFLKLDFNKDHTQLKLLKSDKTLKTPFKDSDEEIINKFDANLLFETFSKVINFIQVKLRIDNNFDDILTNNTINKINNISHYLEEIMSSLD